GVTDRLEREQSFHRSVGSRALIYFEDDFLTLGLRTIWHGEADRNRHGLVRKLTCLDRRQRLPVASQRKFVRRLPCDADALGEALSGETHREIGIGIVVNEPWIRRNLMSAHWDHRHGFGTARNNDLGAAAH